MWTVLRKCIPALFAAVYLPANLVGTWKIGESLDTPGVFSLTEKQVEKISHMKITYEKDKLIVCGKTIVINKLNEHKYTQNEFYNYHQWYQNIDGIVGDNINTIDINPDNFDDDSCDGFKDAGSEVVPGKSIIIVNKNIFIDVGGIIYPITKK
jgi:hypothetical protein